jgi:hypothetical protein
VRDAASVAAAVSSAIAVMNRRRDAGSGRSQQTPAR